MWFLKILLVCVVLWVSVFIGNTIYLLVRKYLFKVKPRTDQPSDDNNLSEDIDNAGDSD